MIAVVLACMMSGSIDQITETVDEVTFNVYRHNDFEEFRLQLIYWRDGDIVDYRCVHGKCHTVVRGSRAAPVVQFIGDGESLSVRCRRVLYSKTNYDPELLWRANNQDKFPYVGIGRRHGY